MLKFRKITYEISIKFCAAYAVRKLTLEDRPLELF